MDCVNDEIRGTHFHWLCILAEDIGKVDCKQ